MGKSLAGAVLALVLTLSAACGKGDVTGPANGDVEISLLEFYLGSIRDAAGREFDCSSERPGPVLETAYFFDGVRVGGHNPPFLQCGGGATLNLVPVAPGEHRVGIQIVRQTSSPNMYGLVVDGIATRFSTSTQQFIGEPFKVQVERSLRTGETVEWRFQVKP